MHRGLFRSDWFRLIPNNSPELPRFYALQHVFMLIILIVRIFPAKYLAVPDFLRTFADALKIVVIYSVKATVSPRLLAVGFFYAFKVSFSRQRGKGIFNMAVA